MDDNAGRGENLNIFYDIAVLLAVIFGYQKQYSKVSEAVCDKQIEGLILSMFNEASIALGKLYNVENSILTLYSMQALKKAEACDTEIAEDIKELKHNLKRTGSLISAALACRRAGMLPRRLAWGIAHAMKVMMEYSGLHALSAKKTDKKQIKKAIRETCGLDSEIELVQLIADFYSEIDQGNTSIEWINNEDHAMIAQAYQLGFMNERNIRGCAKCTLQALFDVTGDMDETLIKASTGLAGGVGLCGDGVCGGYSGGSLFFSHYLYQHFDKFQEKFDVGGMTFELTQALHDRFIETYGGILCKDIHRKIFDGRDFQLRDGTVVADFEAAGAHQGDKCTAVVGTAAQWAIEILIKNGLLETNH